MPTTSSSTLRRVAARSARSGWARSTSSSVRIRVSGAAQLVRGVGHEPLLAARGVLDPVEHGVHRAGQAGDLVVARRLGHPPVEVGAADLRHLARGSPRPGRSVRPTSHHTSTASSAVTAGTASGERPGQEPPCSRRRRRAGRPRGPRRRRRRPAASATRNAPVRRRGPARRCGCPTTRRAPGPAVGSTSALVAATTSPSQPPPGRRRRRRRRAVEPDRPRSAAVLDPRRDGVRLGGERLVEVVGERPALHDDEPDRGRRRAPPRPPGWRAR